MSVPIADLSLVLLYSAMAVYALAFVAYAVGLGSRPVAAEARASQRALAVAGEARSGSSPALISDDVLPVDPPSAWRRRFSGKASRIAFSLTVLAWVLHAGSAALRGLAGGRVPWANMFEFSLTGSLLIVGVFLLAHFWFDLRFLGAFVIGLMLVLLGIATVGFYVDVIPLPPALQSAWLVIHVLVALLATAFFALSFATSALQLAQARRERQNVSSGGVLTRILGTVPGSATLDIMTYRITIIGFILWTFTLMAGSIWAERAWGRYWGWDVKEVWTFIIWVVYAAYIHAKATRGWQGTRAAWLAIIGFAAVLFNFGIVNVFFSGLHSYSGL